MLIQRTAKKKLIIFFWVVVGLTVVVWAFLVSEAFILCPYFGLDSGK